MTRQNIYVKINQLTYSVEKNGCIKVKMEVCAETAGKRAPLHSEFIRTCAKNMGMEKMSVNLEQAANYLIQLFYRTDKRYSCTRTKIGKLLSIVAFYYAREGKLFLDQDIYKYDDCGTIINELEAHVDREVYLGCKYDNSQQRHTAPIDENSVIDDIAPKYRNVKEVQPEVKVRIKEIFVTFCAFSASDLGQCICPIVNHDSVVGDNNKINLASLRTLQRVDFNVEDYPTTLITYMF